VKDLVVGQKVKFKMFPVLEVFTILHVNYEGKRLIRSPFRKVRFLMFLLLILSSTILTFSFLPHVSAEAKILAMTPALAQVGSNIHLTATISNANGSYTVYEDGTPFLNDHAVGNDINVTFAAPDVVSGIHNITLVDNSNGENATTILTISTGYYLNISAPSLPRQLQEGSVVPVNLTITGGDAGVTYVANVTVKTPDNASYTHLLSIVTSSVGRGTGAVTYPGDFPAGANTNFTGEYDVFFNDTLAAEAFYVGLTDSTEYHRNDTVSIKAAGYAHGESVTLSMTGRDLNYSTNLTADTTGTVQLVNQTVLLRAYVNDTYTVNITSISGTTRKEPPDLQTFLVPGFSINITARNIALEPVSRAMLKIFENDKSIANATSDSNGTVYLKLEIGHYLCNASLVSVPDEKVGDLPIDVNDTAAFNLTCKLTNLRVVVTAPKDGVEVRIPEVQIYLTSQADNESLATDNNGTAVAHSLLPNFTYAINASRYGTPFYVAMIPNLFVNETTMAWYDFSVSVPVFTLRVNVTNPNAGGQPINNVLVKVQESIGGLFYENSTVDGIADFDCILGNYAVRVYDANNVKLNETTVILNTTIIETSLSCKLYGLNLSIRIVDYFGQSIPNVNVTLEGNGLQTWRTSGGDGLATFTEVTGGDFRVTARLSGNSEPCAITTVSVDKPTSVDVKLDKYVTIAGMFVETGQLVTFVMIALIIVFILSLEVIRRRKLKSRKSGEPESK
jgi:hypothetical protein